MLHRVDCGLELSQILADILVAHTLLVHSVEVSVKRHGYLFGLERLASVRHVLHAGSRILEVFERFARPQFEKEVSLIGCHAHLAGIGKDNRRVLKSARHVINHHVVQHAGLAVLAFDIQVVTGYLVIEHPLGNLEFGRLLSHRVEQGVHLGLSDWEHVVLKEERAGGNHHHQHNKRSHSAQQRDA